MSGLYGKKGRLYLNPTERIEFYLAADTADELVEKCFCMLILYTGCRMSEALRLWPDQIDPSESLVIFETLKQRGNIRTRAITVPRFLVELLTELMITRNGGRLFPFSRWKGRRIIGIYMKKAGVGGAKATSKGLRRAYAIGLLLEGLHIAKIKERMGHESIETTMIYLSFIGPEERIMEARAWPHMRLEQRSFAGEPPVASVTEVETIPFDMDDPEAQNTMMNEMIKLREANGWEVKQLLSMHKQEADRPVQTAGMVIVFTRGFKPAATGI